MQWPFLPSLLETKAVISSFSMRKWQTDPAGLQRNRAVTQTACTYSFEGSWHGTKEVRGLLENFAHVDHFLMCKKPHTVHSKWLPSRVSTSCWAMLEHFPCPIRACVVSRHGSRRKVINNPKQPHFLYQKKGDCKHHNLSFAVWHRNWSMCAWGYRQ